RRCCCAARVKNWYHSEVLASSNFVESTTGAVAPDTEEWSDPCRVGLPLDTAPLHGSLSYPGVDLPGPRAKTRHTDLHDLIERGAVLSSVVERGRACGP